MTSTVGAHPVHKGLPSVVRDALWWDLAKRVRAQDALLQRHSAP